MDILILEQLYGGQDILVVFRHVAARGLCVALSDGVEDVGMLYEGVGEARLGNRCLLYTSRCV